jgi:hypothetical protein
MSALSASVPSTPARVAAPPVCPDAPLKTNAHHPAGHVADADHVNHLPLSSSVAFLQSLQAAAADDDDAMQDIEAE